MSRSARQPLTAIVAVASAVCLVLASRSSGPTQTAARRTAGLASIGAGLRGPAGLRARVYATGLRNVSAFALDSRSRLWVATSAASADADDAVYVIDRSGTTPVKVIGNLHGPLGLLWHSGTLYVASIDRVDAFRDLRGHRFAVRRRILKGPVAGGWNNGLVWSSGRILMGVSTTCDHCTPASRWAATIVSFRPDGSDLRRYATGIRDGFGLALYPGTGDLLVSMNQRDDLGTRTPGDWLGQVRLGSDWGFPSCYGQGGDPCAGVPRPLAVLDRHAAAGGVAILTRGSASAASVLVAEWARGKVVRVALTRAGTTYRAGAPATFLSGLKSPLAMLATPDGDVFVGDWSTGMIYEITPS